MTYLSVLFLCTGNSARSQMAEALVNHDLGDKWVAFSAGTHPTGYIHPVALAVLAELGIEHQGSSKSISEFMGKDFDLIITVCDNAAQDCPVWLGKGNRLHMSFSDPAQVKGTEAEVLAAFRHVRDQIRSRIIPFLEEV
jgi:arsenate reductase